MPSGTASLPPPGSPTRRPLSMTRVAYVGQVATLQRDVRVSFRDARVVLGRLGDHLLLRSTAASSITRQPLFS
eukprot:5146629-Heterocapsa_arctica.AAC.1